MEKFLTEQIENYEFKVLCEVRGEVVSVDIFRDQLLENFMRALKRQNISHGNVSLKVSGVERS